MSVDAVDAARPAGRPSCSTGRTGSAPTRATRTTPAATPRPRAPAIDPVTGTPVELLWVKGSGGDLGTLTEAGLAVLRLDRLRALVDVYPGVEREDEMVAAFDYCLHGRGGAAPSIDTAMHGLVDAAHVDHLHPDSGIALATAADGEALTRALLRRPRGVGRRGAGPGFQLGLDIAAIRARPPGGDRRDPRRARHHRLGRHLRGVRGALARDHPDRRAVHRRATAGPSRSGRRSPGYEPLPEARAPRARGRAPAARPRPGLDRPAAGRPLHRHATSCSTSSAASEHPRLAALGTSCPDHFLRTKVRPMVLDLPPTAPLDGRRRAAARAARGVPRGLPRLLRAARRRRTARRCAAPTRRSCSCPGVGMFSLRREQADRPGRRRVLRQRDQRHARRRGASRPTPRSPSRRSSASSTGRSRRPSSRGCRRRSRSPTRVAFVTGAGSGHRQGDRPPARRRGRLRRRRRHRRAPAPRPSPRELGGPDVAVSVDRRRHRRGAGRRGVPATRCSRSAASTSSSTTPACRSRSRCSRRPSRDWDLQHDVMARGSFLVSREAARIMIDQAMGGDIVYIVSKNALFAGPNNVAYGASKADQAHQVRLLAAELGEYGIRVNGVNPDGVVRGSGHLRQGLGRRPGADLRHPRGQARRVLRPAHAAQARGPARSTSPPRCSR